MKTSNFLYGKNLTQDNNKLYITHEQSARNGWNGKLNELNRKNKLVQFFVHISCKRKVTCTAVKVSWPKSTCERVLLSNT